MQLRNALPVSNRKMSQFRGKQKGKSIIQNQVETHQAGIAAMMGLNNKALMAMTGMTAGKVSYRLTHTGASQARRDLRNGKGPVAEFLLSRARPFVEHQFVDMMKEKLGLQA